MIWLVACGLWSAPEEPDAEGEPHVEVVAELERSFGEPPEVAPYERPHPDDKPLSAWEEDCAGGDGRACVALGMALTLAGRPDEALDAYEQACELEDAMGCKDAGIVRLRAGDSEGMAFVERACTLGGGRACSHLAFRHLQAQTPDAAEARTAWERGCRAGYDKSCFELGVAYEEAEGGARDLEAAARQYAWSCAMGYAPGCQYLERFYLEGLGVSEDRDRAAALACRECVLQQTTTRKDADSSGSCLGMQVQAVADHPVVEGCPRQPLP